MIAATRLRKGNIDSGHGAARLIGDTLATLRRAVPTTPGLVIVRADSAYFRHDVIAAATAGGARFSVTARMNKAVVRAITGIEEGIVDHDPVPRRDLRRGRATVDLGG